MKKTNKIYLGLIILLLMTLIAFFYFGFSEINSVTERFEKELNEKDKEKDSLSERIDFLKEFLSSDNNYILGQYEEAVEAYKSFQNNPLVTQFEQGLIEIRLGRIDEMLSNIDTLSADIEAFRFSLNNARENIKQLEEEKDSLYQLKNEEIEKYKSKVTEFEEKVAAQQKELNKKDRVQVISFRNEKGNLIHYLGEVKDAKANGGGVGIFDTGGIYKGEWKNNQRHGEGIYTWKDGHKYEGTFVEDIREGQGTYYWSTGEKYVGEWKNNMRNGQGTLYDKDNNVSFEGQWKDDKIKK